jgi:hypothetical protein
MDLLVELTPWNQYRPSKPAKPPWMIVLDPASIPDTLDGPVITGGHCQSAWAMLPTPTTR